jgi:hypothetical protein
MTPGFQKLPLINSQKAIVQPQTQKYFPALIVPPQPQLNLPFWQTDPQN